MHNVRLQYNICSISTQSDVIFTMTESTSSCNNIIHTLHNIITYILLAVVSPHVYVCIIDHKEFNITQGAI